MEAPIKCPLCGDFYGKKGFATHQKSCRQKTTDEEDQARYMARRRLTRRAGEKPRPLARGHLADEAQCVPDPASSLDAPAPHETGSEPAPHEINDDPAPYEIDGDPAPGNEIRGNSVPYEIGADPLVAASTTGAASQPQDLVSSLRLKSSWVLLI